jgi:hypothetical protein
MKTTLIIGSVAAVALWGGYTIGFLCGVHHTYAKLHPNYSVVEVTTSHKAAINTSPDTVTTNSIVGK